MLSEDRVKRFADSPLADAVRVFAFTEGTTQAPAPAESLIGLFGFVQERGQLAWMACATRGRGSLRSSRKDGRPRSISIKQNVTVYRCLPAQRVAIRCRRDHRPRP